MAVSDIKEPCHILLAIDGSEHSYSAAALLQDLPLPQECSIRAVGVFRPRDAGNLHLFYQPLDKIQKEFEQRGIRISTELLSGSPAEVIIETSQVNPTDLIVLGAKGLRATLGILLGGVAQQVVEYSNRPVLIVRAPYAGLQHVLLVTDGSEHSQRAVEYMGLFKLPKGTDLKVLYVLPPLPLHRPPESVQPLPLRPGIPTLVVPEPSSTLSAEQEELEGKELLRRTVDRLHQILPKDSDITISSLLMRGDAATEIIDYVKTHHIDLIIAGSLGTSKGKGWKLGSVSRKLLHYAGCSVLIVRETDQAPTF
jgi:nucleotide-binding universal stress UspA family protein